LEDAHTDKTAEVYAETQLTAKNFSPKWRRAILPSRWIRLGSIDCKMIDELHTVF
jgi:hypothetical protein